MLLVGAILFIVARFLLSLYSAKRFYTIGFKRASVFMFFIAFFTSPLLMWLTLGDQLSD